MKVTPDYFWYHIEPEEIDCLIKTYVDEYRNEWEHTRLISYYAASGMNKMPSVRKFMPFKWDEEAEESNKPKPTKRKPSIEMMKLIAENNKII